MKRVIAAFGVFLVLAGSAWACFKYIAPVDFAVMSPIIVQGKIVDVKVGEPAEYTTDYAIIKVDNVLQNAISDYPLAVGDTIEAVMSGRNSEMKISTDIHFEKDREAIWLLALLPSGEFSIRNHPVQCQSVDELKKLEDAGVFKAAEKRTFAEWKSSFQEIQTKVWENEDRKMREKAAEEQD